ncbi:probable RNA polymerase sigma factor HI_1459 [Filimonas sp.]|nr:probable RNA polymerase sigma factor HI_1459 [Filimonas sp.]
MQHRLVPEKWIDNYADYLFSHASYRANNKEQAEDLVQETFLSACKGKDQFEGNASEKTWLMRILKNKIIDLYRKNARERKVITPDADLSYFFDEDQQDHWTPAAAPKEQTSSALVHLEQKEMSRFIEQCLALLPPIWHQISQMKRIDEEKTDLICKVFDITASNLWVIMHRTKMQLRDCIEKKSGNG